MLSSIGISNKMALKKVHLNNQKKKTIGEVKKNLRGWGLMTPGLILFSFFIWIPLIYGIIMSFSQTKGGSIVGFAGFSNYQELFEYPEFSIAFKNTFVYLGWSLLIGFLLPMILGLLMSETIHFKALFRVGIYLPCAIAGLTVSILFTFLFDPSSAGFLNNILIAMGKEPISWLSDKNMVIPLIVVTMTWRGAGSTALIYLSAFQQIDTNYYEAARIDGAGAFNRILHITLPSIIPQMTVLFVLQVISVMQVFYEPLVMTHGGGADSSSLSLLLLAYNLSFGKTGSSMKMGVGSACTVILALIILGLSIIYFSLVHFLKKRGYKV